MSVGRAELLQWLNELLQLNYTKIEQCGAGGAYLQVLDSIYGDVPMSRVKMNAKTEPEFVHNYKLIQNVFKAKKIDKEIPVERLIKCKNLDNLEFLQWLKRFWDSNYGGQGYDPVARRRGAPADPPGALAPTRTGGTSAAGARVGAGGRPAYGGSGGGGASIVVVGLQRQVAEMSAHLEGLEKERDFYFAKLRDIEILVQGQLEVLEGDDEDDTTLREIQKILYSTEDGFEVPEGDVVDEEETF